MRNYRIIYVLLGLLLCYSCQEALPLSPGNEKAEIPLGDEGDGYVPGLINIYLTREAADSLWQVMAVRGTCLEGKAATRSVSGLLEQLEGVIIEPVFHIGGKYEARQREFGLDRWFRVKYTPAGDGDEALELMTRAGRNKGIEKVERVARVVLGEEQVRGEKAGPLLYPLLQPVRENQVFPFNDPQLNLQWALGPGMIETVPEAGMGLFDAWTKTTGKPEVIVAVLDMGIDYGHQDLSGNMWKNSGEIAGNGIDDDGNGYIDDIYGYNFVSSQPEIVPGSHGTHIAGTIAATNQNGMGVCGIAGGNGQNPGVRVMSCQVGLASGGSVYGVERAFEYAADNGAVICSCSWYLGNQSDAVHKAIRYFIRYAGTDKKGEKTGPMKGGAVFFAAANNRNSSEVYPPAWEDVMTVAAVNVFNQRAYYSNYGKWVNIAAPGGSAEVEEYQILSTLPRNSYGYMQGTSMACPHVAGVAALVASQYADDPSFTCEKLNEILLASVTDLSTMGSDTTLQHIGLLRADLAVGVKENIQPAAVTDIRIENKGTLKLHWTPHLGRDGNMPCRYLIYAGPSPLELKRPLEQVKVEGAEDGKEIVYSLPPFTTKGKYEVTVVARNLYGRLSEIPSPVTIEWNNDYTAPEPVVAATVNHEGNTYTLRWKQVADLHDGTACAYQISCQTTGGQLLLDTLLWVGDAAVGEEIALTVDLPETEDEKCFYLVSVDAWNNKARVSAPFSVGKIAGDKGEIRLYPNPVEKVFRLTSSTANAPLGNIRIYDVAGRLVYAFLLEPGTADCDIDISFLAPGWYMVKVSAADREKVFRIRKL